MAFGNFFKKKKNEDEDIDDVQTKDTQNSDTDYNSQDPENPDMKTEQDFERERMEDIYKNLEDEQEIINTKKKPTKNLIILGVFAGIGIALLAGTSLIINNLSGKKEQNTEQVPPQEQVSDQTDLNVVGDANDETTNLANEAIDETQTEEIGTEEPLQTEQMTEEEFQRSLNESDRQTGASSAWDDVGSDPYTSTGTTGDLSTYDPQVAQAEREAALQAQKEQEKAEKLKKARSSALSFGKQDAAPQTETAQNTGTTNGAVVNGRVDTSQVPAGTYTVNPDGSVTQVATNQQSGQNAQPQNQNYNPFTQTNPNITGRGQQGYGSVNTNPSNVIPEQGRFTVSAGNIIPVVLQSGIKTVTSDMTIAVVSQDVYDTKTGKYLLIPKGSRLIGEYSPYIDGANFRVITIWNRIIFPNGESINLAQFKGVDLQGYGGMKAQVNTHFWRKLGNVIMSTITAVAYNFADRLTIENGKVKLTKYTQVDENGEVVSENPATLGEVLRELQQGAEQKNSQIQTVLTIKTGTRFNVRVNSDLIFDKPYRPYHN